MPADSEVRIKLSPSLLGLAGTYRSRLEFAYWWGPSFTDDLSMLQDGVTVHQETSEYVRMFTGVQRSEFWWHTHNEERVFEVEEVRERPTRHGEDEAYACRYAHSILEPATQVPNHLDGSIREYSTESMLERIDQDIRHSGKHTVYTKLWRVDGRISVPDWKALLTHHFRDVRLIGEYLGGTEAHDQREPATVSASILDRMIPTRLSPGSGVRLSVTYREETERAEAAKVVAVAQLHRARDALAHVEADVKELIIAMRRRGVDVHLSPEVARLLFEDSTLNLGLITYLGSNSMQFASVYLASLRDIVASKLRAMPQGLISASFGVPGGPSSLRCISIAGTVSDLAKWLESNAIRALPECLHEDRFHDWVGQVSQELHKTFPQATDSPITGLLAESGLLAVRRVFLGPEELLDVHSSEADKAVILDVALPRDPEVLEAYRAGRVTAVAANQLRESTCSRCRESYVDCACSKYLDPDVTQVVKRADFLGAAWAERSAWE